ncbi:MAG: hypothetical protein D6679_02730 [Candidatus Hydrogenedentota bacterium]|nr:MAG: hypothetical protein D6679_02730 [Candidatus Hydrogenedentota bacterium]
MKRQALFFPLGFRILFFLVLFFGFGSIFGCGTPSPPGIPTVENRREWEGVGIWEIPGDTDLLEIVRGPTIVALDTVVTFGGLQWRFVDLERLERGFAGAWPGIEDYWVAVRIVVSQDTRIPNRNPLLIHPAATICLRDSNNEIHSPVKVHQRLVPRIDLPLFIDSHPRNLPIIFSLRKNAYPVALEILLPPRHFTVSWDTKSLAPLWRVWKKKLEPFPGSGSRTWELRLERTRFRHPLSDSSIFDVELNIRNISNRPHTLSALASSRIYAGSGRTFFPVSFSSDFPLQPGRDTTVRITFSDIPTAEALEMIVPFSKNPARFSVRPGLNFPRLTPVKQPFVYGTLQVALYAIKENGRKVHLGFSILSSSPATIGRVRITGQSLSGGNIAGRLDHPIPFLFPQSEERRWVTFSAPVSSLLVNIPNRPKIRITW